MAQVSNGESLTFEVTESKENLVDSEKICHISPTEFQLSKYLDFFSSKPLFKFKDFLQARFLYLTGARDCGHPVLIVDGNTLKSSGLHAHPNF